MILPFAFQVHTWIVSLNGWFMLCHPCTGDNTALWTFCSAQPGVPNVRSTLRPFDAALFSVSSFPSDVTSHTHKFTHKSVLNTYIKHVRQLRVNDSDNSLLRNNTVGFVWHCRTYQRIADVSKDFWILCKRRAEHATVGVIFSRNGTMSARDCSWATMSRSVYTACRYILTYCPAASIYSLPLTRRQS